MVEIKLLLLIGIANGTPVIAKKLLGNHGNTPVDLGRVLRDGNALFGSSKTYRGIVTSILVTALVTPLLNIPLVVGVVIAVNAMLGDMFSSFIKRRLGMPPSSMALGLDQIPESLLPLVVCRYWIPLSWMQIFVMVSAFFVLELILSRLLYALHIRNRPY